MPSVTQPGRPMVSPFSKKRRREDGEEAQLQFTSPILEASQELSSAINSNDRTIIPTQRGTLPVTKKFRRLHENDLDEQPDKHDIPPVAFPQPQQSHFSHAHPDIITPSSTLPHEAARRNVGTASSSPALLSPCHVCHRKPTKKSDLDSFADCMGCRERTCFVCLRACQGWLSAPEGGKSHHAAVPEDDHDSSFVSLTMQDVDDEENTTTNPAADRVVIRPTRPQQPRQKKGEGGGAAAGSWSGLGHREVICSRCCIERGSEGEVVCLGCLAHMEGA